MIFRHQIPGRAVVAALMLLTSTTPALAARALVLNAFSAEGLGLGGADVATTRDTVAVNINPAALTQIQNQGWDGLAYSYYGFIRHTDTLGNDDNLDRPAGTILAGSYARRLTPNLVWGTGLFAQGGTGIGYSSLLTEFGNRDELSSSFGVYKLVNGLGWSVNDKLSLGATLGISYAQGRQKVFPQTSDNADPANPFFGLRFDGGKGVSPNVQLGLRYTPTPAWTLAVAYISKIKLPLHGGTATVNYSSIGLGRIKYERARIDGFALPQEVDLAVAYRPDARWMLTAEVNWLDYSGALKTTRFRARNPEDGSLPEALASLDVRSPLNWDDQYVFAFGAAYELDQRNTLRGGLNFQNNPITDETFSPVLNLGQRRMVTFGYGRKLDNGWMFDVGVEYQFRVEQTYENPSLRLGPSGRDYYEDVSLALAFSRRW